MQQGSLPSIDHIVGRQFLPDLRVGVAASLLALAAFLSVFVSPLVVIAPLVVVVALWLLFTRPLLVLGIVLAYIPIDFMAIALGKFIGLPHMTVISIADKELILSLLLLFLWSKNGFKATSADWFLVATFMLALVRTAVDGSVTNFALDLAFVIPYAVGRMTVLPTSLEAHWARLGVWIASAIAVLGMIEVFVLGERPRTILYLAIESEIEGGQLTTAFRGVGFAGLREAATMVGPNGFGAFCMIALIIWWVYFKQPLPAVMIGAGLLCTLTRAAWLGTGVAIVFLAMRMGQKKRLYAYVALAGGLVIASIPVLGISDFLHYNKMGEDPSASYHQSEIPRGIAYDLKHPFGSGNKKISPLISTQDNNSTFFETTYPAFAAAYGIPAAVCLVGFLFSAMRIQLKSTDKLGYVGCGILLGMCVVMMFTNSLIDRRLIIWAFFPVGLAIRSCVRQRSQQTSDAVDDFVGKSA